MLNPKDQSHFLVGNQLLLKQYNYINTITTATMLKVKCEKCGYEWDYKGDSEWYVTCPRCKTSINVRKDANDNQSEGEKNE